MVFTRACEYGIRATLHLASKPPGNPVLVRDIAEDLGIPFSFLAKIIQTLGRRGVVNSYKGPGGGVTLSRSSDEITLMEIVEAIDGLKLSDDCILGIPGCSESDPCPAHARWKSIREDIVDMLSVQTVAGFARQLADSGGSPGGTGTPSKALD